MKAIHLIINRDKNELKNYYFPRIGKNDMLSFRKYRYRTILKQHKLYEQLERQQRLLENGQSISQTHLKMLKRFKEQLNGKLPYLDRKLLTKIVKVMEQRVKNKEALLLGRLESFRNLRKELGV